MDGGVEDGPAPQRQRREEPIEARVPPGPHVVRGSDELTLLRLSPNPRAADMDGCSNEIKRVAARRNPMMNS